MGITGFFLGLTRFYWVLLGFSGSCWIFIRFQILPACSQGYSFGFCGFVSSFQPSVGGAAVIGGLSSIKKRERDDTKDDTHGPKRSAYKIHTSTTFRGT